MDPFLTSTKGEKLLELSPIQKKEEMAPLRKSAVQSPAFALCSQV